MLRDRDHGPVIVVGVGGGAAETLPGKSVCLAPLDQAVAREMVRTSAASQLVPEERLDDVAAILVALGDLALDHAEVSAVDVNPVVVGKDGVVAVDALVVVGGDL